MTLDEEDVEAIAQRVAQLLRHAEPSAVQYVDAARLARVLGVERDWVYAHAADLSAIRLGGVRGRLRFDLDHVTRTLSAPEPADRRPAPRRVRRTRSRLHSRDPHLIAYES